MKLNDDTFGRQVIESHVIPEKPYHSNILVTMSLRDVRAPAVQGDIRLYRLNGQCKSCSTEVIV